VTTSNEPTLHRWEEPEPTGCGWTPKPPPAAARDDAPKPGDVLDVYGPFPGPDGVDWWAYCRPTPDPILSPYAGRVTVVDDRPDPPPPPPRRLFEGDQA